MSEHIKKGFRCSKCNKVKEGKELKKCQSRNHQLVEFEIKSQELLWAEEKLMEFKKHKEMVEKQIKILDWSISRMQADVDGMLKGSDSK